MKLRSLIEGLEGARAAGDLELEITGVQSDSRRVRRGDLFVAIRGEKADGRQYIANAISAGASAVVFEAEGDMAPASTAAVRVPDARRALARLADRFHGSPSARLKMAGVTGTNGKTTVSCLIASILEQAGLPTGIVGTLSYRFGDRCLPAPNTTPPADDLQALLAQMLHAGMQAVAMEVSSHALAQHRTECIAWDVAVFTNLTQDHLDYHGTMDAYFKAKQRLFQQVGDGGKSAVAVLNRDDPRFDELRRAVPAGVKVISYGLGEGAEVRAVSARSLLEGCHFTLETPSGCAEIFTPLCGTHNVSNSLAAAAAALALGVGLEASRRGIAALRNVDGRLERIEAEGFSVFVDYAHTEDALRRVLAALRPFTHRRLIVVFGCGGGRDRLKRPLMGRAVNELADFSFVTSDNPRLEDPQAILAEILVGMPERAKCRVIADRSAAIHEAIAMAQAGDIVLLAGKGHETYQEIGGTRMPFDDRIVAREALRTKEATCAK